MLYLHGCKSSNNKEDSKNNSLVNSGITIPISLKNLPDDNDSYFSNIEDIEFVPLQTEDSTIIGNIQKIKFYHNRFYILDKFKVFSVFNRKGKLLFSLQARGKGKNEQLEIRDFCILENGAICLLDYLKYYEYDSTGKYIKQINFKTETPINPTSFHISPDSYFLYEQLNTVDADGYALVIKSINNSSEKKYFKYKNASVSINRFIQSNTDVIIPPITGGDTIFQIIDNDILPKYVISFTDYKKNEKPLDKAADYRQIAKWFEQNKLPYDIQNVLINNNNLHFTFTYEGKIKFARYQLIEKTVFAHAKNLSVFDPFEYLCSNKNILVSSKEAYFIKMQLDNNKTSCSFLPEKRRLELLEQIKNVKETDNPVLMLIKTK